MHGEINVLTGKQEGIITFHLELNENHSQFLCVAIQFYGGFPQRTEIKPSIVRTWSKLHHTTWTCILQCNELIAVQNTLTGQARSWVFDGRKMRLLKSAWQEGPEITTLAKLKPVEPPQSLG